MAHCSPRDLVKRYLGDAIASERSFEDQLRKFGESSGQHAARHWFAEHADQTRDQRERLESRLLALGGNAALGSKSILAEGINLTSGGEVTSEDSCREDTLKLILASGMENAEIAMYECIAAVCAAAGDAGTERLARTIQEEERRAARKAWDLLAASARLSFEMATAAQRASGGEAGS